MSLSKEASRKKRLNEAIAVLHALGFTGRQSNDVAAYSLLALLGIGPQEPWAHAKSPLLGITPIIAAIKRDYQVAYAPNTRETVRDEAVKYFVDAGLLLRNPDQPTRPTNSGKTVYQIEPEALAVFRTFDTLLWSVKLKEYLGKRDEILAGNTRVRALHRVPVRLPSGAEVTLSPGGQNPLIKAVIEEFCQRWVPGGYVAYIGDAENKFIFLDAPYLKKLGVEIDAAAKMPDVVIHDTKRDWLVLIEAVSTANPVDTKRRSELKALFSGFLSGLVFVTAFADRATMQSFVSSISWESEVWIADAPDHLVHFNGERYLGPYPDVSTKK